MSRRRSLWRKKLGHPEQVDSKTNKIIGKGSQCRGDRDKLETTKPSNMKKAIPDLKRMRGRKKS